MTTPAKPLTADEIADIKKDGKRMERVHLTEWTYSRQFVERFIATIEQQAEQIEKLQNGLDHSVSLQSHYARLLNDFDGGERTVFSSTDEWLHRLEVLAATEPVNDKR